MGSIRLVTLDVTNTIIRVLGGVGQNYAQVANIYGRQVEPTKLNASFKTAFKRHNQNFPNFGVRSGLTPVQWWNNVVVDTFVEAGYNRGDDLDLIAHHLYAHFSTGKGWEVLPGTKDVLTKIRAMDIQMGVISNFDERLEKILGSLGIRHFFDFVLASAVVGEAKPEGSIFNLALQLASVQSNQALHVGDNVITDYLGAKNAGFSSVLLATKVGECPKDVDPACLIHNFEDVIKHIR